MERLHSTILYAYYISVAILLFIGMGVAGGLENPAVAQDYTEFQILLPGIIALAVTVLLFLTSTYTYASCARQGLEVNRPFPLEN